MKTNLTKTLGLTAFGAALLLLSACNGHYNPRLHIDETPPPPGQVKTKYYNQ